MGKIKLLSEKMTKLIAAGEVVEKPASIVKELVENSIDAGASSIIVEISDGGQTKIVISDDGCGMNKDDILLSVKRLSHRFYINKNTSFKVLNDISFNIKIT